MKAIIFDTETTGGEPLEMIEAAWVAVDEPFSLLGDVGFCQRYRPSVPITLGALATHHILEHELADCPSPSEFELPETVEYLIGHNVDYDWKVIGSPDVKRICTLALCRKLWPECDCHTQGAMLYHLIDKERARKLLKDAHSAFHDVMMCKLILLEITQRLMVNTWEELWQESEVARVPEIMPFGKHKGMKVSELPWDYKAWLLRQSDIDPYLVKALRGEVSP